MFCKWCGGNLAPSDSKCKRCGRDVPALSDCGGFYDLVPGAEKTVEVHTVPDVSGDDSGTNPSAVPSKDDETAVKKESNKRFLLGLTVLTLVGFVLVLVILLVLHGKVERHSEELNELRNDLQGIPSDSEAAGDQIESSEETEPKGTTESAIGTDDSVISEQDVYFTLEILKQGDTKEYLADFDLGECSEAVSISYVFGQDSGECISAIYTAKSTEGLVKFGFHQESEYRTQNISVTYEIDEVVFGLSADPETCNWQYRIGSEGGWEFVPEDTFVQTDTSGETGLSIAESALQALVDNNEGTLELRCEICRTNTDGGSATLIIEGIGLYQEANDENDTYG